MARGDNRIYRFFERMFTKLKPHWVCFWQECKQIWMSIWAPFAVPFYHKHDFCLWFTYVIFAGLLGVIINVVKRCVFDGIRFQDALVFDSQAGSFYMFSLVLCASLIWPIFKSLTHKEQPEYHLIKTILLTILIFTELFCAIFYSFSHIQTHKFFIQLKDDWNPLDVPQFIFFILALALSFYSFGLAYLQEHRDQFHLEDEHLTKENHNVGKINYRIEDQDQRVGLLNPETQQPVKY